MTACSVVGCERPSRSLTWCGTHYERWRRHGTLAEPNVRRFWSLIRQAAASPASRPDLGPCWLWQGDLNSQGYARLSLGNRKRLMHRWAYEWLIGAIPDRLTLDHLCRVRRCVNPAHLEPVTQQENALRGARARRKTHCKRGHPLSGLNVYTQSGGGRDCRTCRRLRRSDGWRVELAARVPDEAA